MLNMSITTFPDEIILNIMLSMDGKNISNVCLWSKKYLDIYSNSRFWQQKMAVDYFHIRCALQPTFQSYKWLAWTSQQIVEFNNQLDAYIFRTRHQKYKEMVYQCLIDIGPKILNEIDKLGSQLGYEIDQLQIIDMQFCIRKAFGSKQERDSLSFKCREQMIVKAILNELE